MCDNFIWCNFNALLSTFSVENDFLTSVLVEVIINRQHKTKNAQKYTENMSTYMCSHNRQVPALWELLKNPTASQLWDSLVFFLLFIL